MRECSPSQTCHITRVIYHVSCVKCNFFFLLLFPDKDGEAYRWRVCYQRAYIPRLAYKLVDYLKCLSMNVGLALPIVSSLNRQLFSVIPKGGDPLTLKFVLPL